MENLRLLAAIYVASISALMITVGLILFLEYDTTTGSKNYLIAQDVFSESLEEPPSINFEGVAAASTLCPSGPIVTTNDDGRLGNKMWEYASVWTLAKKLRRPAYVPHSLRTYLSEVFVNLSLPDLDDIGHCNLTLSNDSPATMGDFVYMNRAKIKFAGEHVILKKDIAITNLVLPSLNQLKKEFTFHPDILKEAEETVERLGGKGRARVGVHVRRTDYIKLLRGRYNTSYSSKDFYLHSMEHMRRRLKENLIFLIVSDDLEWCRENLLGRDDVVIASKNPGHDMALMANSHHTIIDYGTFGQWGAMLASLTGGHTIVYKTTQKSIEAMAKFLKNVHLYDANKKRLIS